MPSHLFPLHFGPDGILQLQGETRLCLTDNKNLKGGKKTKQKQNIRSPGISGVNFYHPLKKDSMKRIALDRQAVYAHWEQTWDAWNSCSMTTSSLTPSTQTWFSAQANDLALIREEPNSVWVFTYFPRISGESTPASVIWIYQAPRTVWAYWHRFVCFY